MVCDLVENAPMGLHLADGEGRIVYANRYEHKLLGCTSRPFELVGSSLSDLENKITAITIIII